MFVLSFKAQTFCPFWKKKKDPPPTRVATERTDYCTVLLSGGLAAHVLRTVQERAKWPDVCRNSEADLTSPRSHKAVIHQEPWQHFQRSARESIFPVSYKRLVMLIREITARSSITGRPLLSIRLPASVSLGRSPFPRVFLSSPRLFDSHQSPSGFFSRAFI